MKNDLLNLKRSRDSSNNINNEEIFETCKKIKKEDIEDINKKEQNELEQKEIEKKTSKDLNQEINKKKRKLYYDTYRTISINKRRK